MAPMTEGALLRRSRWMYELGRARWASRLLLVLLPLLLVARLIGRPAVLILALGGILATAGFGLSMLHDRYARAVRIGVLAGVPAFLLPLLIRSLDLMPLGAIAGTIGDPCVPAAFLSGVAAGWMVSRRAADEDHLLLFWAVAVATTALTGSLGCSVAGGGGVVGMIAGVLAGSAPVVVRSATQRN
jgi:hypothetical protein